jgi:hypothetical protein
MADFVGTSPLVNVAGIYGDGDSNPDFPAEIRPEFVSGAAAPAVVTFITAPGPIASNHILIVRAIGDGIVQTIITVDYVSPNRHEVAFRGLYTQSEFDGDYTETSTVASNVDGYTYAVVPNNGWRGNFTMHVTAINDGGYVTTQSTAYTLTISTAPSVSNITPPELSTIDPNDAIAFRTHSPTGMLSERVYADLPTGAREFIWDGTEFSERFSSSTRVEVVEGQTFDYVILRTPGWPADPTFVVQLSDVNNNVEEFTWGYELSGEANPQVLNISPVPGTEIETTEAVSFRTYDSTGLLVEFIYAEVRGVKEVVWQGDNFSVGYAHSTRDIIDAGRSYDYVIRRDPAWSSPPVFSVKLVDLDTNSITETWTYTLAAVVHPGFGGNTGSTDIEFSTGDIYDALFQSVGDGLQAGPDSIVEAWRLARAEGLQVATCDARAMKQAFPNFATDFLPVYESILGVQLDQSLTVEEKQIELARLYTQVVDASGPSLEDQLHEIHPSFEIYAIPYEHTYVTEVGVRAFEDWHPLAPLASGPRYDPLSGRTFTNFPNYSSMFKVHVWLNVPITTEDHWKAIMAAREMLAEALPAWVDFVVFEAFGFILDQDRLDVTVFGDGLPLP